MVCRITARADPTDKERPLRFEKAQAALARERFNESAQVASCPKVVASLSAIGWRSISAISASATQLAGGGHGATFADGGAAKRVERAGVQAGKR